MVVNCESKFYDTLDELQETYKSNHPDKMCFKKKYGEDVKFCRIMHPKEIEPRFELSCYKII